MKDFFEWLKWFFWDSRRCEHEPGGWHMIELGMGKVKACRKCGKVLEIL